MRQTFHNLDVSIRFKQPTMRKTIVQAPGRMKEAKQQQQQRAAEIDVVDASVDGGLDASIIQIEQQHQQKQLQPEVCFNIFCWLIILLLNLTNLLLFVCLFVCSLIRIFRLVRFLVKVQHRKEILLLLYSMFLVCDYY